MSRYGDDFRDGQPVWGAVVRYSLSRPEGLATDDEIVAAGRANAAQHCWLAMDDAGGETTRVVTLSFRTRAMACRVGERLVRQGFRVVVGWLSEPAENEQVW